MPTPFTHRFRVRYAEVDPQSVVFNSRYLEYADLVLTEYWRALDLHFSGEDAIEFHVVRAEIDFRSPIRADELVDGRIWTERVGRSSVTTRIELHGASEDSTDDLRAAILLVHVHVDLEHGRPLPIPDGARRRLTGD
ncbi:MAG: acyl-CoA thioesterase [Parasphingopyxis sp.]